MSGKMLMSRIPTLISYCDDRAKKDTRGKLSPGCVPELHLKWLIGLAMVEDWQLSVGFVSRFYGCSRGNASRMIRKTRAILQKKKLLR